MSDWNFFICWISSATFLASSSMNCEISDLMVWVVWVDLGESTEIAVFCCCEVGLVLGGPLVQAFVFGIDLSCCCCSVVNSFGVLLLRKEMNCTGICGPLLILGVNLVAWWKL